MPVLVAALAGALVLAGCGGSTGNEKSSSGSGSGDLPLVYGVFATPLEEPWDGAIHAALQSAADDGKIEYKYIDNLSTSDAMERSLRDIATNEKPDAIMGDAFAAEEAVRKVAADFPDIPFAFGSGEPPVEPNMSVFDNWLQDPAYLAGMLAGGLTKSNTIGMVAAMPIPEVNRIVNAFVLGVKETNTNATVKVSFINSFFDPAAAKQAAQAQIAAGADVLFAERDGVIAAAKEADLPVIGMMVDQQRRGAAERRHLADLAHAPDGGRRHRPGRERPARASTWASTPSCRPAAASSRPSTPTSSAGCRTTLVSQVEDKEAAMKDGSFTTPVDESAPAKSIDVSTKWLDRDGGPAGGSARAHRRHQAVRRPAGQRRRRRCAWHPVRSWRCSARTARASRR